MIKRSLKYLHRLHHASDSSDPSIYLSRLPLCSKILDAAPMSSIMLSRWPMLMDGGSLSGLMQLFIIAQLRNIISEKNLLVGPLFSLSPSISRSPRPRHSGSKKNPIYPPDNTIFPSNFQITPGHHGLTLCFTLLFLLDKESPLLISFFNKKIYLLWRFFFPLPIRSGLVLCESPGIPFILGTSL